MRAIDADALYKKLNDIRKEEIILHGRLNNENCCTLSTALFEIDCAPTIEPERKKGKWIDGRCSICGCDIPAYIIDWKWQKDMDANYCPVCVADMRGDEHDL